MKECKRMLGDRVGYCDDMYDAVLGADAMMLLTEWKLFRISSWSNIRQVMNQSVIFDGRNIYDVDELKALCFACHCIGKS